MGQFPVNQCTKDNAQAFLEALIYMQESVVWDWGFPPHRYPCLAELKKLGAVLWWFDAPCSKAHDKFLLRRRGTIQDFNGQAMSIQKYWPQIREIFEPNILVTLRPDGTYLSSEEVFNKTGLKDR